MDPEDRLGARFSSKATREGMGYEVFQEQFTVIKNGEECFDLEGLKAWYGES